MRNAVPCSLSENLSSASLSQSSAVSRPALPRRRGREWEKSGVEKQRLSRKRAETQPEVDTPPETIGGEAEALVDEREQRRNQVEGQSSTVPPLPQSPMSAATERSRRLCRFSRTLIDDTDEDRTPTLTAEPEDGHDDDVGLFMDLCISICVDEVADAREYSAGRLTSCAGGCARSSYSCGSGSDCTADTVSSSSTSGSFAYDSVADPPTPLGPPRVAMRPPRLPRKSVGRPGGTKKPREGSHALPPPSPLRINIVYRDRSFGSESGSSVVESTTTCATESTATESTASRQQRGGPAGARSGGTPTARNGWKHFPAWDSSPEGRWKEYIDYESGNSYFANGSTTTWSRPVGAFVESAPSPGEASQKTTGRKRVSGSTLRMLFSGKRRGSAST